VVLEPITVKRELPAKASDAFDVYTRRIGEWWPAGFTASGHSLTAVIFEPRVGGRLYECGDSGDEFRWGTVQVWEPGHRVVHSWLLAQDRENPSQVEVAFVEADDGCRFELEHRGWTPENAVARSKFADAAGWPVVLADFYRLLR
jgi:uncharacterized protein YndB with AHSA1/START domain